MITNFLNFVMVAGSLHLSREVSFRESVSSVFFTVLPSQFATGLLTAGVAFSYQRLGVGAVGLAAVVLFVFQYLLQGRRRRPTTAASSSSSARRSSRRCSSAWSTR